MSWRVSFFKADKKNPVMLLKNPDDDNVYDYKVMGECISYDTATDLWCLLKDNEEFQKEIHCFLYGFDDIDVYSITKEGFKMIILEARKQIIEYMRTVLELDENPELAESGDYKYCRKPTPRQLVEEDLREWEESYTSEKGTTSFFNIELDVPKDKFGISSSWKYKYGIFDLIEIYKYFDWDNYTMIVYGG
jgi:hypothetical protein